jgi:hypothetical protein
MYVFALIIDFKVKQQSNLMANDGISRPNFLPNNLVKPLLYPKNTSKGNSASDIARNTESSI